MYNRVCLQISVRVYNGRLERMFCIILVDKTAVRYQNNTSNEAKALNRNGIRGT
jgi:hypothetical protein